MALMQIDPGVILWTLIIFAILLGVLGKFAWKPILKAVHERELRIRESVEKADAARLAAERALQEHKALTLKNREEAAEFLKHARQEAERTGADLLAKARRESEELTERARRQIDEERQRAVEAVRVEAVELAMAAASHLLEKSVDQANHRALVQTFIAQLPKNLSQKN